MVQFFYENAAEYGSLLVTRTTQDNHPNKKIIAFSVNWLFDRWVESFNLNDSMQRNSAKISNVPVLFQAI